MMKIALASLLAIAACGAGQSGQDNNGIAGLAVYPGATAFCDGRVYTKSPPKHLSWKTFGSSADRATVAGFYDKQLTGAEKEDDGDSITWRYKQAGEVTTVLSLHDAAKRGPWNSCATPAAAKTIILQSTR